MVHDDALTVFSDAGRARTASAPIVQVVDLEFDVLGKPMDLSVQITQSHASLADVVPLARAISAKITRTVIERLRLTGNAVPCCKGCSACCSYLVPLAIPEVFRLRQETLTMPEIRRTLTEQQCLMAARRILDEPPPDSFADQHDLDSGDHVTPLVDSASDWYKSFRLPCPFLYENACTVYDQRPMACREHSVTGSPTACSGGPGVADKIQLPLRMPEVLGRLASDLEGTGAEALILPFALFWADENAERGRRTWPTAMMVQRLADIVRLELARSTAAVTCSH